MLNRHAEFAKRLIAAANIIEAAVPYVQDYRGLSMDDPRRLSSIKNAVEHLREFMKFGYFDRERFLNSNIIDPVKSFLEKHSDSLSSGDKEAADSFLDNVNSLDDIKAEILSKLAKTPPPLNIQGVKDYVVTLGKLLKAMTKFLTDEDITKIIKTFYSFNATTSLLEIELKK